MVKKEDKNKKSIKPVSTIKKTKEVVKPVEQQFFAKDLADQMGITSYDFLLIKREAGIEDGSPITMSKMQNLYDKIIRR